MMQKLRYWLGWACGILAAGLFLTDCFGGPTEHVQGTLTGHTYHPPYTTVTTYVDPKTHVPHTSVTYHPAQYWLYVQSQEGTASVSTGPVGYATTHDGEVITYARERTRWSNYTWGDSY
jgi:hypothetical protein